MVESKTSEAQDPDVLKYRELREKVEDDTGFSSFLRDTIEHPAFQEILKMGDAAIPIILEDVRERPSWMFLALYQLTQHDPIADNPPEIIGGFYALDFDAMRESWLRWEEEDGHINPVDK